MKKVVNEEKIIIEKLIDIEEFGIYRMGLTTEEIKKYLKNRACTTRLGHLYDKFCRVAGINTVAVIKDEYKNSITLMYRWDVKRFADAMLKGTATYWD